VSGNHTIEVIPATPGEVFARIGGDEEARPRRG
jgi:hypothetical protein